jgi:gas vesicle protein
MSENGNGDFFKGLFFGGVIGGLLGILYAPKSGERTRRDIHKKTDEFIAKGKEGYEDAVERTQESYQQAVKRLKELQKEAAGAIQELENRVEKLAESGKESVSELADRGKKQVQDKKGRVRKAVDAGVDAYKEEKSSK